MLSKETHALLALFLVLFIDGMGQGLIFPILTNVIINPQSHEVLYLATREQRTVWYGVIVCSFFFTWFFGAAILGNISDQAGRKKALLICLTGSALGYLLSALAFWWHSIWFLVLGRIIYGFTAGSQPIAQASIADISSKENKARNMGFILLAVTLGIMAGPIIGSLLSDSNLIGWFRDSTPLYFACILSIVNLIYLATFYRETSGKHGRLQFKIWRAAEIFISAFKNPKIRYLSICFMILQMGWSIYYLYITIYLVRVYGFTSNTIGLFFAAIGLGLTIGFAILVKHFNRFSPYRIVAGGNFILMLGILITALSDHAFYAWFVVVPATAGLAVSYAYFMTLFSNHVSADKQGWVMGVTGAIVAFAAGSAILLSTLISSLSTTAPLWFACLLLLGGAVMVLNASRQPNTNP